MANKRTMKKRNDTVEFVDLLSRSNIDIIPIKEIDMECFIERDEKKINDIILSINEKAKKYEYV